MTVITENGYGEVVLHEYCDFPTFHRLAERLGRDFAVSFLEPVDDFDTLYRPFVYQGGHYVLHYNVYTGARIYPQRTTKATASEQALLADFDTNWSL